MGMVKAAIHDEVYRICELLGLEGDGGCDEELMEALWKVATVTLQARWEARLADARRTAAAHIRAGLEGMGYEGDS